MGLLDLFSGELTDRKVRAARKRFWQLARREAVRFRRNEVWYADIVGCCLRDEEVIEALRATGRDPEQLSRQVAKLQSPDERSDVAARSGAFVVTDEQFSWPLDRAFDRAVAARRRQGAGTVRPLDVFIGALAADELDLAKHVVGDSYALHFELSWEVAHPGEPHTREAPEGEAVLVVYPDPFTPKKFVQKQLGIVPSLDDQQLGAVLEHFEAGDRAQVTEGAAPLLAGLQRHIADERAHLGHPLRVEVEPAG